jgi:hypothetical protein
VGYWSHFDYQGRYSSWPLPPTNEPADLATFGAERGIQSREPLTGDVYLLWSTAMKQHARAGIVVEVVEILKDRTTREQSFVCNTIEGETTEFGAPVGEGIHLVQRTLTPTARDRILRWTSLDARGAIGNPAARTKTVAGRVVIRRAA